MDYPFSRFPICFYFIPVSFLFNLDFKPFTCIHTQPLHSHFIVLFNRWTDKKNIYYTTHNISSHSQLYTQRSLPSWTSVRKLPFPYMSLFATDVAFVAGSRNQMVSPQIAKFSRPLCLFPYVNKSSSLSFYSLVLIIVKMLHSFSHLTGRWAEADPVKWPFGGFWCFWFDRWAIPYVKWDLTAIHICLCRDTLGKVQGIDVS